MKKLLAGMSVVAFSAVCSLAIAQQAPDAAEADSSLRLEARLQPVIAVDASGQARLDVEVGMANDRFTAEVEIAKADFGDLGIAVETASGMKSCNCASCVAACRFLSIVSSFPEIFYMTSRLRRIFVAQPTRVAGWRCGARDCKWPLHASRPIPGPLISVFNLDWRGRRD